MIKYILILINFTFISCTPNKVVCLMKSHMQYNCASCMEQHEICYICNYPCEINEKNSK